MSPEAPSSVTARVDDLMRELYRLGRGELHQTLVADYTIADAWRNHLDGNFPVSSRFIVRVARASWCVLSTVLGARLAARLGGMLWMLAGLPGLLVDCMKLHAGAFIRQGPADSRHLLLRTGVSNEPLIARWVERRENSPVQMLQYDNNAAKKISCLRHLPVLWLTHIRLCLRTIDCIDSVVRDARAMPGKSTALVPAWFVVLARTAMDISWYYCWARICVADQDVRTLTFTMNYAHENAFRLALPAVQSAYVEHGFPRRDIPPLPCKQYVYSAGYAAYLRSFDANIEAEVIGLDYFDQQPLVPTRTIVIASLQDWARFGISQVKTMFNAALAKARATGWRLVFRTRFYDADAFATALAGPWDEVSLATDENFHQCLVRTRPAMVWTTWSTAVLDARAHQVVPVAFVTRSLDDYFISDLPEFACVITAQQELQRLCACLEAASVTEVMRQLDSISASIS